MSRIRRVRYVVLALLCAMYFITYIDRTNISVAGSTIAHDLHLSKLELGLIYSAFSYPYALLQLPGGFVGDLLGARLGLAIVSAIWAGATLATGFGRSFVQLFVLLDRLRVRPPTVGRGGPATVVVQGVGTQVGRTLRAPAGIVGVALVRPDRRVSAPVPLGDPTPAAR